MTGEKVSGGDQDEAGVFETYANKLRSDLEQLGFITPYPGQSLTGIRPIVAYFNHLRDPKSFSPVTGSVSVQTDLGKTVQSWVSRANPTNPLHQTRQYNICPDAERRFVSALQNPKNLESFRPPLIIVDGTGEAIGVMKPGNNSLTTGEPTVYGFVRDDDLGILPNTVGSFTLRPVGDAKKDSDALTTRIRNMLPKGPDAYTISRDALLNHYKKYSINPTDYRRWRYHQRLEIQLWISLIRAQANA